MWNLDDRAAIAPVSDHSKLTGCHATQIAQTATILYRGTYPADAGAAQTGYGGKSERAPVEQYRRFPRTGAYGAYPKVYRSDTHVTVAAGRVYLCKELREWDFPLSFLPIAEGIEDALSAWIATMRDLRSDAALMKMLSSLSHFSVNFRGVLLRRLVEQENGAVACAPDFDPIIDASPVPVLQAAKGTG